MKSEAVARISQIAFASFFVYILALRHMHANQPEKIENPRTFYAHLTFGRFFLNRLRSQLGISQLQARQPAVFTCRHIVSCSLIFITLCFLCDVFLFIFSAILMPISPLSFPLFIERHCALSVQPTSLISDA